MVHRAPEGALERTAFDGLRQACPVGVQPSTSTGQPAARIDDDALRVLGVPHQPEQYGPGTGPAAAYAGAKWLGVTLHVPLPLACRLPPGARPDLSIL